MKVELVGSTKGEGKYENLNHEEIISAIARHGVIKEDNGKLIKYLMDNAHWSPLDMVDFIFEIETSRAIGRQWLRHASIKPQEYSQRYSDRVLFENIELRLEDEVNRQSSTEVVALIESSKLKNNLCPIIYNIDNSEINNCDKIDLFTREIRSLLSDIEKLYNKGIKLGIAKECMRNILPECTTSTLTFKGSVRSWLSFLNVRLDFHSQKEIQELALLVGEELERKMPNVFSRIDWRKGMFM